MRRQVLWGLMVFMMVAGLIAGCGQPKAAPTTAPGTGEQATVHPKAADAKVWLNQNVPGFPTETLNASVNEGSLMLYHLVFRDNLNGLVDAFQQRFPFIRVERYSASGGPLTERFTAEVQSGRGIADVWMNTSPAFANKVAKDGMLLNWTPPNDAKANPLWKSSGYWYGIGLAHIGIAWNTQAVTPAEQKLLENMKTWDELATPAFAPFKSRSAMVSVKAGGTTQLPYFFFDQQYGNEFWNKLDTMYKPVIFSGVNPLSERLAAGEFALVPHATADTAVATLWLKGAPVQWRFPEPGLAVPYMMGISSIAPHTNAAKLFVAWSVTEEGQAAWVNATGLAPTNPGIADKRPYASQPWYKLPSSYFQADWDKIEQNIDPMTKRFDEIFAKPVQ